MEGINKIRTSKLVSLSEQELLDCDTMDHGCEGGLTDTAFYFIQHNQGLTTEDTYPFAGADGSCNSSAAADHAGRITGFQDVPPNDEVELMKAVAHQPTSVAIEGGGLAFMFYYSGVFNGPCGTDLNHAVAAVGYGVDGDGSKYWIVKNSWGTDWGEAGYIRMAKDAGPEGLCGIAKQPVYPFLSVQS